MELPVVERFPHWLRWLLVLPVAVAAYAVVQLINVFAPGPDWLIRWFGSLANPCAFVLVGSLAAPKARFAVSVVLAILISVAQSLLLVVATIRGMEPGWSLWAAVLIGIVGAGAGATIARELRQDDQRASSTPPAPPSPVE